ncbi:hypothetical protein chiPu_0029538 [Chiloscyllium punctatum]|uniref:Uncharacterized protein n=1 Tax=Chiloscyllium punctatum TaxID=137246 RepID=A0A401TRG5_CHIPU|nr:hypothetical protein [Chiloscyllium punctatum]
MSVLTSELRIMAASGTHRAGGAMDDASDSTDLFEMQLTASSHTPNNLSHCPEAGIRFEIPMSGNENPFTVSRQ